jgi:hypothetical protein
MPSLEAAGRVLQGTAEAAARYFHNRLKLLTNFRRGAENARALVLLKALNRGSVSRDT